MKKKMTKKKMLKPLLSKNAMSVDGPMIKKGKKMTKPIKGSKGKNLKKMAENVMQKTSSSIPKAKRAIEGMGKDKNGGMSKGDKKDSAMRRKRLMGQMIGN